MDTVQKRNISCITLIKKTSLKTIGLLHTSLTVKPRSIFKKLKEFQYLCCYSALDQSLISLQTSNQELTQGTRNYLNSLAPLLLFLTQVTHQLKTLFTYFLTMRRINNQQISDFIKETFGLGTHQIVTVGFMERGSK